MKYPNYAIRNRRTGKFALYNQIEVPDFYWTDCQKQAPHTYSDIGHAKAAITRAIKEVKNWSNVAGAEAKKELILGLEVVEVEFKINFEIGATVFQQVFAADEI